MREDPENRNLVFAALEVGVFVSFNGGDQWQPLQLNLPAASCRDLAIEQNDLIVATYGRALWAIDDLSPLRELASKAAQIASSNAYLYAPAPAVRMQWDTYTDTPLNPDVAAAENSPDGAIIDYYLGLAPVGDIQSRGLRRGRQTGAGYPVAARARALAGRKRARFLAESVATLLPKNAGLNRFVWDLRYPDPEQLLYTYYGIHVNYFEYTLADHAIPHNTPWHEPQGPMVLPGQYEVRLTAGGQTYRQPITLKLDPRLQVSTQELQRQLDLAQELAAGMKATYEGYNQAAKLHSELADRLAALKQPGKSRETLAAAAALDGKALGLTDAAGPPAEPWGPIKNPGPHAPDDRRGSIRHAAGQPDHRDLRRHVPGHPRRAGALERSAHQRCAAVECDAGATAVGAVDRTGPGAGGTGLRFVGQASWPVARISGTVAPRQWPASPASDNSEVWKRSPRYYLS